MFLTCARCGDVIGVYEPVVVSELGVARETSRAAEPGIPSARGELYHRDCYRAGITEGDGPEEGAGAHQ